MHVAGFACPFFDDLQTTDVKMPPMTLPRPARPFAAVLPALAALALAAACSSETGNPPPIDHGPDDTGTPVTMTEGGGTGSGTADDTGTDGSSTGAPVLNCQDITCTGHGGCEIGDDGNAYCACDEGYIINEAGDECIVDETCVKVRFLEDRCRQLFNGPAAVSLFFALDFCSGTAVTSAKFEELGLSFQVLESGEDIADNPESESTILPTSVESYVTLVVDVSDSVTGSENLPALVAELRNLVTALQPSATDPDVYLSVYVFGRFVAEYVPFTRDFATVDTALAQIEEDPASVVALVNGEGTALYEAVAKGIKRTQRIRDMRDAVSWGGVLSTGTVVVITDGDDSSNSMLDNTLLSSTLNQVISIGISEDINDADLETIGRDGSFLAPTPADWSEAFAEVAQRVAEYPDRAYLLAYCSSTTSGEPNVEVNVVADTKLTVKQTAACKFYADLFSSDPGLSCGTDLFTSECDTQQCGGLTACGACADDQCCDGFACDAPVSADAVGGPGCAGLHELCSATDEVCVGDSCVAAAEVGAACDPSCMPGEAWCDPATGDPPGTCTAALPLGSECTLAEHCESLNCQQTNPDNQFEPRTCQLPALTHDRCEGAGAVRCEEGAYCQGNACEPKKTYAETCSGAEQCRSGSCATPVETQVCVPTGVCYWAWDEKAPT
jgi:hypothetical protein